MLLLAAPMPLAAQHSTDQRVGADSSGVAAVAKATTGPSAKKPWYESFSIRGYGQIRYNRLLETNPDLKCEQCDRSWGDKGGLFIRRARIIFSGYVHPRVFI